MTRTSRASSRAAAARTADDLLARRAAQFREREQELHRLVTDYHDAATQARKVHADAQTHAVKITTEAEKRSATLRERADKEASVFEDAAHTAVRAILQSGESRSAVASLTHLTVAQVRAIERTQPRAAPHKRAASTTRQPDDHDISPTQPSQ